MTDKERKLALYCLKASSDYHSEVCDECINYPNCDHTCQDDVTETIIKALEQEPKIGHCKDCQYATLILGHEICSRWGGGCKTKEDGYCFMYVPKEG